MVTLAEVICSGQPPEAATEPRTRTRPSRFAVAASGEPCARPRTCGRATPGRPEEITSHPTASRKRAATSRVGTQDR